MYFCQQSTKQNKNTIQSSNNLVSEKDHVSVGVNVIKEEVLKVGIEGKG